MYGQPSPLYLAIIAGDALTAAALLTAGADPCARATLPGMSEAESTLLHMAAVNGMDNIVYAAFVQ